MPSKYRAKPTVYNGVRYASKAEAHYASILDLRMRGRAKDRVVAWSGQPKFPIVVNGVKVCVYIADFLVTYGDGRQEVIDVKGFQTPMFRLKKKLFEACYKMPLVVVK